MSSKVPFAIKEDDSHKFDFGTRMFQGESKEREIIFWVDRKTCKKERKATWLKSLLWGMICEVNACLRTAY